MLHYGQAEMVYDQRARVLVAAHAVHPERFLRGAPRPPQPPTGAWINKPRLQEIAHQLVIANRLAPLDRFRGRWWNFTFIAPKPA